MIIKATISTNIANLFNNSFTTLKWKPLYPVNSRIGHSNAYPVESDLSGGQCYPPFVEKK